MAEVFAYEELVDPALMVIGFAMAFFGMLRADHNKLMNGNIAAGRVVPAAIVGAGSMGLDHIGQVDPHTSAFMTGASLGLIAHTTGKYILR